MSKGQPVKSFVAKAPLFDQLTAASDFARGAPGTCLYLEKDQLLQSIQRETSDILNARSSFPEDELEELRRSSTDESSFSGVEGLMGLPNSKIAFPEGGDGWPAFASQCEMMVRMYETRLNSPSVKIDSFDPLSQAFLLTITGSISIENLRENVSFAVYVVTDNSAS
jgi:predicted component of type VI protein secretion system